MRLGVSRSRSESQPHYRPSGSEETCNQTWTSVARPDVPFLGQKYRDNVSNLSFPTASLEGQNLSSRIVSLSGGSAGASTNRLNVAHAVTCATLRNSLRKCAGSWRSKSEVPLGCYYPTT